MMILSQAAPFDMATTSGIAQSVTLRFVDGAGAAKIFPAMSFVVLSAALAPPPSNASL